MSDLISRQAVLDALKEHRALYCDNTPDTFSKLSYAEKSRVDELDTAIATIINLPSVSVSENPNKCFDGMTNGEVMNHVLRKTFPRMIFIRGINECNKTKSIVYAEEWENAPYKAEKPETCKGCLEPCIMYEPDMRACKKKVTEKGEE